MPDDDAGAAAWRRQVAAIAAHRDFSAGPTTIPTPARLAAPAPAPAPLPTDPDWSRSL